MRLTGEQKRIVQEAVNLYGDGKNQVLKVNALAGTGKTTTMLAVAKALVEHGAENILYLVFNKHMQLEIEAKVKRMGLSANIQAKTINAVAYHFARKRGFAHIQSAYSYAYTYNYKEFRAYQNFCRFFKQEENRIYADLLEKKKLDFLGEVRFLADHGDELSYDVVILDEAQDTNPCMLAFFQRVSAKLKIMVGDQNQSIYLFNGSVNAMRIIKTRHNLNLTVSFRTRDRGVQGITNRILRFINPKNPTFRINSTQPVKGKTTVYLTRTNAAAIKYLQDLADENRSVGINVTQEMLNVINDLLFLMEEGYSKRLPGIDIWDIEKAAKEMFMDFAVEENENKDTLLYEYALLYALSSGDIYELESLKDLIELYRVDPNKLDSVDIYITTTHRFKGLEAPYVYIDTGSFKKVLNRYRDALEAASDAKIKRIIREYLRQEYNLLYIALTRAINGIENMGDVEEYVETVLN